MTELRALEAAMLRVLFERAPAAADLALLGDGNVLVYRELSRARIDGLLRSALPRSLAALASEGDAIASFLHESPPSTRFFRELPLVFADRLLAGPAEPAHLPDLVRLERARWHAMIAEEADPADRTEFDLTLRPVFSTTATLLRPHFSVHLEGDPRPTEDVVLVFRRPDHVVETRWMRGLAGRLVEAWARGEESAIDAARRVAESSPPAALVETLSDLGATLLDHGAIRGSRP